MTRLTRIPTRNLVWLLPLAFALHELEEWNIIEWYQRYWSNVDPDLFTRRNSWTWLAFASALGFVWTFVATRFRNEKIVLHTVLLFFVVVVFGHTLAHIYWQFSLETYAPGVVTSALFVIPSTLWIAYRAIHERLVWLPYVVILFLLCIPQFVGAIRIGNRVPDGGIPFLVFASWLADVLRLGA